MTDYIKLCEAAADEWIDHSGFAALAPLLSSLRTSMRGCGALIPQQGHDTVKCGDSYSDLCSSCSLRATISLDALFDASPLPHQPDTADETLIEPERTEWPKTLADWPAFFRDAVNEDVGAAAIDLLQRLSTSPVRDTGEGMPDAIAYAVDRARERLLDPSATVAMRPRDIAAVWLYDDRSRLVEALAQKEKELEQKLEDAFQAGWTDGMLTGHESDRERALDWKNYQESLHD